MTRIFFFYPHGFAFNKKKLETDVTPAAASELGKVTGNTQNYLCHKSNKPKHHFLVFTTAEKKNTPVCISHSFGDKTNNNSNYKKSVGIRVKFDYKVDSVTGKIHTYIFLHPNHLLLSNVKANEIAQSAFCKFSENPFRLSNLILIKYPVSFG